MRHRELNDGNTPALKIPNKLFLYDLLQALTFNPGPTPAKGTLGTGGYALVNVRISDGGNTTLPMHLSGALANRDGTLEPDHLPLSMVMVGMSGIGPTFTHTVKTGDVFAEPPHQHRDLPNDIFASDRTYTITAWAVNGDGEVVSPVAALEVRPVDTAHGAITGFFDYKLTAMAVLSDLVSTEFTVLK